MGYGALLSGDGKAPLKAKDVAEPVNGGVARYSACWV